MFHPFRFLWKQFNGPQITAISQAIYEYLKSIWDNTLDYFNGLSVATANSDHLTLIGLISGLTRPIIDAEDVRTFFFTDGLETPTTHGFSDADDPDVPGGVLSDLNEWQDSHKELLPTEVYRRLLLDYVTSDGERGGLTLLDNFIRDIWLLYRRDEPNYYIRIETGIAEAARYGDVWIYLGPAYKWGDNAPYIDAIVDSLSNYIYAPEPRIFISYSDYTPE